MMRSMNYTVNRRMRMIFSAAALFLFLAATAHAQITTSAIQGVVKDSSDAVMPGVDVEIRNVATNISRSLTTDAIGRFNALNLAPGQYSVTLKLAGFATVVLDNVLVTVGETASVSATMKVSTVATTVTVTTESPAVDPGRTTTSSTIDENTIKSIPILGR